MPIYEYRCTRCGNIAEEWVKSFNSPMSEPCPKCGAEAVRIVSDTSFQLKGGGWYVTEYKKSGASQSHEPSSDHSSSEHTSGATTETTSTATDTASTSTPAPEASKASTSSASTESTTASAAA